MIIKFSFIETIRAKNIIFGYLFIIVTLYAVELSFWDTMTKSNGFVNYTLWISRCIATARERIPGSIDNYVTGVSECSQQRGNLKDDGYIRMMR